MKVLGFNWHSLWRRSRRGPVTMVGTSAAGNAPEWPSETRAGDLLLLYVDSTEPIESVEVEGWTRIQMGRGWAMYYRIAGWVQRMLRLPGPARGMLFVFRNATLSPDSTERAEG